MKKFTYFLVGTMGGFLFFACQGGVHAGGGEDDYQPRPAPVQKVSHERQGKLHRLDLKEKTVAVRVENGMIETFDFDKNTRVSGLEDNNTGMRNLQGKEGSEVTVKYDDNNGAKLASKIEVTEIVTATPPHHKRRRH